MQDAMGEADKAIVDGKIEDRGEMRKTVMRQRQINDLKHLELQMDIKRMEKQIL